MARLSPSGRNKLSPVLRNAVEESAVLHTRILCEIFLSPGREPDDIHLSQLFSDWHSSEFSRVREIIDKLREQYGKRRWKDSPCWIFNKMMAHPTDNRSDHYDYTPILNGLRPVIQEMIAEIERLREAPFTWSW
jgi:hypothetical protein